MAGYPFSEIEPKWQRRWAENQTFRTLGPGDDGFDPTKPKYYVLDMFPYPSGAGLHVGHPEGYTATDILARYKRMNGFNVLHPMGWDAFGLPAEQYAIETGTHPRETTERNVKRFREQLQMLGFSYDWEREINTTDPDYFRWTQWIFLRLFERGLAYQAEVAVNWCPALGTVLSNEEVIDGKSERGGHPVIRRPMRQWMLKITEYADRLLEGLDNLDWPESVKEMQRNWIGRSEGSEVEFPLEDDAATRIRVFTTRPDTLFGATYMVLAPEHELVARITTPEQKQRVEDYQEAASRKSDLERSELQKEKSGVFTGAYAINPVNGNRIPVWIGDYVLATYGTGAVMAVPGHDERDFAFAKTYDLPIVEVVEGGQKDGAGDLIEAFVENGPHVNSDATGISIPGVAESGMSINGLDVPEAKEAITEWLEMHGVGRKKVNYKLRDWLFSRQRYWGEPIPVLHVDGEVIPLPDDALPLTLPEIKVFQPTGDGEPPLARAEEWMTTIDPSTGKPARRESNTMPQWAGSCWYYLRYIDPTNDLAPVDPDKEKYWMPVDLYVGGAEHAVLHLLYARFWHMVLFDAGVVSTPEPFRKLINQGMILGEVEYTGYRRISDGAFVSAEFAVRDDQRTDAAAHTHKHEKTGDLLEVVPVSESDVSKKGEGFILTNEPDIRVDSRAHKMSKSRGNVVNPDDVVKENGADSLRLYEMFMGPLEQQKPWSTRGVEGVHRFLSRVWRLATEHPQSDEPADKQQLQALHLAIKKVTEDIEGLRFNTAIAAMMEFVNTAYKWKFVPREVFRPFLLLLSPFAPHVAEELWERFGNSESLTYEPWPPFDESLLVADTIEMAVQVNGKLRGTITIPAEADRDLVLAEARAHENVARYLEEGTLRKEVVVPKRLVNFVVSPNS